MWECPKCETLNDGEICIVCSEPKPKIEYKEPVREPKWAERAEPTGSDAPVYNPEKPKRGGAIIFLVILMVIIAMVVTVVMTMENKYANANDALEDENYSLAKKIYNEISFYRDSAELLSECDYQEALDLMESDQVLSARNIFLQLGDYKDSADLIKECDYITAKECQESGEVIEAYDKFAALGGYKDSQEQLEETLLMIYNQGVDNYRNKNYAYAEECFLKTNGVEDSDKYLTLINARNTTLSDISGLYDLIDFEDTKDILESDEYIELFLIGYWDNGGENYIEFYRDENNSSIWCRWNFPAYTGKHWKIQDASHYVGDDSSGWTKQCSYEIIDVDTIRIHCYKDGRVYVLNRR